MALFSSLIAQNPLGGKSIGTKTPFAPSAANPGGPIEQFLSTMLGFITVIGGLMFLVYVVLAGLNWITAGGDKGKLEAARSQITSAIVGLIIVIVSQTIVGIAGGVLGLDILNPARMIQNIWSTGGSGGGGGGAAPPMTPI